jgi:hypothetical protein
MSESTSKKILDSALTALLKGLELSPWVKVPTTFIIEKSERGRAQASIALHMARLGDLQHALQIASQINSNIWRTWIEKQLMIAARFDGKGPTSTSGAVPFEQGVDESPTEPEPWLKELRLRARENKVWNCLLEFIQRHPNMANLNEFWVQPCSSAGEQFFTCLRNYSRSDLLREMRCLIPVLAKYGSKDDLIAVDLSVRDVGKWWQ